MSIRSFVLAFAAVAAIAATSLSPANAAVFGPRHFARISHHFAFSSRPGVNWCRRGNAYICQ